MLHLTADGRYDPTFAGGDGVAVTDFGGSTDRASSFAVQPGDGKVVVVGYADGDFAAARYSPDGALDPTFGKGGKLTLDLGGTDRAEDVTIQSDGKIVIAGSSRRTGGVKSVALARLLPDGTLDPSFGTAGEVLTNYRSFNRNAFSDQDVGAKGVALQSDGKIVIAGTAGNSASADVALARYTASSPPTVEIATSSGSIVAGESVTFTATVRARRSARPGRCSSSTTRPLPSSAWPRSWMAPRG